MKGVISVFLMAAMVSQEITPNRLSEHGSKSREKRSSYICWFGLEYLLKEALLSALLDYRENDPLEIGSSDDGTLTEGVLRGLSTLKNLTDFEVFCVKNSILVFASSIGLTDTELKYKWLLCDMIIEISGSFSMKVQEINVAFEIHLNTTSSDFEIVILEITRLVGLEVDFSGLGPLNPLVRGTMKLYYFLTRGSSREKLERQIRENLDKKLNEVSNSISLITLIEALL